MNVNLALHLYNSNLLPSFNCNENAINEKIMRGEGEGVWEIKLWNNRHKDVRDNHEPVGSDERIKEKIENFLLEVDGPMSWKE